ncbi:Glutamate--tRNA ligase [Buchnera aphidicola (Pterocallis alni)]|uniref:glutamate--tRNA ligase n=1 Tax=Buchnera aphidicola TaxID=9 RepID=UPI003463F0B5
MHIKTRFAPSSSGLLHIGNIRTALYSWLFAKKHGGSFVLRIEDTDINRSNIHFIHDIIKTLNWLGIHWDCGPYLQSERLLIYKEKIDSMLDSGHAYKCYCSVERLEKLRLYQISQGQKPQYDRVCRNSKVQSIGKDYVIRFKNPLSGQVCFHDQIRGKIIFNNLELDDLIIQRRNGMPTYNFCVVIDDLLMGITHVIRGEDHINNTPRQINILTSLHAFIPHYAHVSMVIDHDKNNLSKRKSAMSILKYKNSGFLKEAILNYVLKLGWSYGDREIFNILEMKKLFSIRNINKSASEFNFNKLLWFNNYYLNNLPINDYLINIFKKRLIHDKIFYKNGPKLSSIISLLRSRCNTINEMSIQSLFFFTRIKYFHNNLIKKYCIKENILLLSIIYKNLFFIKNWSAENIILILKKISIKYNCLIKNICMPVRIAITGMENTPSINHIVEIIGKKESLIRIRIFYSFIKKNFF